VGPYRFFTATHHVACILRRHTAEIDKRNGLPLASRKLPHRSPQLSDLRVELKI
jgi:hypothetical protein